MPPGLCNRALRNAGLQARKGANSIIGRGYGKAKAPRAGPLGIRGRVKPVFTSWALTAVRARQALRFASAAPALPTSRCTPQSLPW